MTGRSPGYEELLEPVQQQRQIDVWTVEVARLRVELEEVRRAGKCQTAPFRKDPPKPNPKTPGRKPGEQHGEHAHRPLPPPDQIDEIHEACLPETCPHCAGCLVETGLAQQYQTEIPHRPTRQAREPRCPRTSDMVSMASTSVT